MILERSPSHANQRSKECPMTGPSAASACIGDPSVLPSQSPITFIIDICGTLKRLKRRGWVMRQVPFPESDSDHMHRVAMISMLYHSETEFDFSDAREFYPHNIDATKLLRMALTHDLCEAIAGDITPHCKNASSRRELESDAMNHIRRIVGDPLGPELAQLWKEYEDQVSPTALIVKDIDKFEMLCQAYEYEKEHLVQCTGNPLQDSVVDGNDPPAVFGEPLRDFFCRQQGKMNSPLFKKLDAELRARRQDELASKGWGVQAGER